LAAEVIDRTLTSLALAALLGLSAGCSDDSFHVERGPEFPRGPNPTIAVFGVYRDGRLAPEAWDLFRQRMASVYGPSPCEPGYPDILAPSGTAALQAVDDYTRENGVTDELLDKLAPMTSADLLLLLTLTGRPSKAVDSAGPSPATTAPPPTMRGSGRRGASAPPRGAPPQTPTFEAVGILFSVKAHKSVEAIRMTYTGQSMDEALERFTAKLGSELSGAKCGTWKADLHIEASDVRRLATE
jgi:hypothetical protein